MAPSPTSPNNDQANVIHVADISAEKLNQLQTNLFSAIRSNDLYGVKKTIEIINKDYGKDSSQILNNFKTSDGKSLLQEALYQRFGHDKASLSQTGYESFHFPNIQIISSLIDSGIDLNKANLHNSPLILAVTLKDKDLVELFIKKGADINARDPDGKTALHHALEKTNLLELKEIQEINLIVTNLLKNNAEVNIQDSQGQTPYHYATQSDFTLKSENNFDIKNALTETIDLLKQAHADPDIADKSGKSVNDMIQNAAIAEAAKLEKELKNRQPIVTENSHKHFSKPQTFGDRIQNFFQAIVDFITKPFTSSKDSEISDIPKETISTIINPKKLTEPIKSSNVTREENKQIMGEALKGLNNNISASQNHESNNIPTTATTSVNKTSGQDLQK